MLNRRVVDYARGRGRKSGDFGIEIELEGTLAPFESMYWTSVPEGSLRHGIEYITMEPYPIQTLDNVLADFEKGISQFKVKHSIRTSTHIHINVSSFTLQEVYTVVGFFWLFENLLVKKNGKDRQGNLFCLRSGDAELLVYNILAEITNNSPFTFSGDNSNRYASINLASVRKFGSLEFRFLRSYTDSDTLSKWVRGLYSFVHKSRKKSLSDFLIRMDSMSSRDILEEFFPKDFIDYLIEDEDESLRHSFYEGYCYALRLSSVLEKKGFSSPNLKDHREDIDPVYVETIDIEPQILKGKKKIAKVILNEGAWDTPPPAWLNMTTLTSNIADQDIHWVADGEDNES